MIRYSYMIIEPWESLGDDDSIRAILDFVKSCGYEGVELNLTTDLIECLGPLEGWIEDSGLVVPSFLTGAAYNEGLCLSSPDAQIRRHAVERLIGYLDIADRFNAMLVVGLLQGLHSDEPDPEVAGGRIVECLQQVGAAAAQRGVDIVIEPVNHLQVGFNNSVAEVLRLIDTVGSPAVKPMVDTIHMNIEDPSLTGPIYDCGPALRHVHLCESNGARFGTGHIDFTSVLQELDRIGYDGFASVKVYRKAALREAAQSSIEYLRRLRTQVQPEE